MFSIFRSEGTTGFLRQAWEQADEPTRQAILGATERLNHALAAQPHEQGESRLEGRRILFEAPLGVEYEIDDVRRVVHICRAWAFRV